MRSGFLRARDGNVAILFGICIVPLLIGVGLALDMLRGHQVKAELAESADAGVLAAARAKILDPTLTTAAATTIAQKYFDANRRTRAELDLQSFVFNYDSATRTFSLTATGRVRTALLGVVGKEWIPINIHSEARVAPPRILEAVLVLDNTQSMSGAKISALKTAANSLVDQIMTVSTPNVKVGLVPFSKYVNVGVSRRNEPWLDVPADWSNTTYSCHDEYPDRTYSNCVTTPRTCSGSNDGVPVTWACNDTQCDVNDGAPVQVCGNHTESHVWNGCVGSRNAPHDVMDSAWGGQRAPGLLDEHCPNELTPLTTDKTTVVNAINAMSVQGDTYIPAGLFWGQALISSSAPFTEAATYSQVQSESGVKAVILMTDGMNTLSANYPAHNNTDTAVADAKTLEICAELKSNDVEIYTVAFQVPNAGVKAMLDQCATDPSQSYDANDADALNEVFLEIGRSLTELALSK